MFEPRAVCSRCERPARVCYCAHLPSIPAETRVLLLQHPREEHVAIGTARMASLCLPGSQLVVGTDLADNPVVRAAVSDPARPAILLYPGDGATDVAEAPPEGPVTLVVVDGTWALAKKLLRLNPFLRELPRYAFTPRSPSDYRIRREPHEHCVSTIEAVAHMLGALEKDPARFAPMLVPFRAMVDMQIDHEKRIGASRHFNRRRPKARPPVPEPLLSRRDDLVCVAGEANAWPYREPTDHPDELVHWLAYRPSTGERFEAVIAPRRPLAPGTTMHTRLSADDLARGLSESEFHAAWRAFSRDDDVLCSWGHYAPMLLGAMDGALPRTRVDLRHAITAFSRKKPGTVEAYCEREAVAMGPAMGQGRGGERLARCVAITRHLIDAADAWEPRARAAFASRAT